MKFLEQPPRYLFFTGKGGVGKTSIACASAIQLAESGQRVLLNRITAVAPLATRYAVVPLPMAAIDPGPGYTCCARRMRRIARVDH